MSQLVPGAPKNVAVLYQPAIKIERPWSGHGVKPAQTNPAMLPAAGRRPPRPSEVPFNPTRLLSPSLLGLRSPRISQYGQVVPPLPYPYANEP